MADLRTKISSLFTNSPAVDIIFQNLDFDDLLRCRLVCTDWKNILDTPTFWMDRYIKNSSLDNASKWKKFVNTTRTNQRKETIKLLMWLDVEGMSSLCPLFAVLEFAQDREIPSSVIENLFKNLNVSRQELEDYAEISETLKWPNGITSYVMKCPNNVELFFATEDDNDQVYYRSRAFTSIQHGN